MTDRSGSKKTYNCVVSLDKDTVEIEFESISVIHFSLQEFLAEHMKEGFNDATTV